MPVAAFALQSQTWGVAVGTVWYMNLKIFTFWPFTEKVYNPWSRPQQQPLKAGIASPLTREELSDRLAKEI